MTRKTIKRPFRGPETSVKFYLTRVNINEEGFDDYGRKLGVGAPLYKYCSERGKYQGYVRGETRELAKVALLRLHPFAEFFM